MTDSKEVYIVTGDDQRYVGDLETTKRSIKGAVEIFVRMGKGLVIVDASPELTDFLRDLQKQYPWRGDSKTAGASYNRE